MAEFAAPRRLLFSGAGVYLLAAGCTAGQGVHHDHASVLLVTLASTRADHLEPYGAHLASTPTLRRLAAEGVLFERAYSASPLNLPSDATLLTGLNPPAHGLRVDRGGRLPDDVVTLAERMAESGYLTAAFTGSLGAEARWGLDQGFAVFSGPGPSNRAARDAADVVDSAINRLYRVDGPVFAWVELPLVLDAQPTPGASWGPNSAYDAQIAATDAELGRLLSWWERRFPDSVQVVTSDHGYALGEGGEAGSGALLTDATLRVPLVLRGIGAASDRVPVGERVDDPVGLVDVAPTLLSLADLRAPREMEGNDLLDEGSDEIYSEAVQGWGQLGLAPLYGFTDEDGRYVEGAWGAFYPASGLRVSVEADPSRPVSDLAERLAELREDMGARAPEEVLADLDEDGALGGDLTAQPGRIDPRNVPELVALMDEVAERTDAGQLWAAEQRIRQLEGLTEDAWGVVALRVQLSLRRGRLSEAVALLAELYQRQPGDNLALQLGRVLSAAGRWEEAEPWFDAVLASRPEDPRALAGRVRVAIAVGDLDIAEVLMAGASEGAALDGGAALDVARAELLLAQGRAAEALPLAEAAMARDPVGADGLAVVASARWALGRPDEALDLMGEALEADRYDLRIRSQLATWMLELGRADDAARLMAPAASLSPGGGAALDLYQEALRAAGGGWPG